MPASGKRRMVTTLTEEQWSAVQKAVLETFK